MNENEANTMPESEAIALLKKQLKEKDEIIADKDKTILQLINDAGKNQNSSNDASGEEDKKPEKTEEEIEKEKQQKRFEYYKKMLK